VNDFQTPPRERGLELREFVRGVPQVEIRVRPASESGLEPARDTLHVHFVARPPEDTAPLCQTLEEDLPALGCKAEILVGELARLDFAVTGWEEAGESGVREDQPPANELPKVIAGLEPMRVEPIQIDAASRESSGMLEKLEPLHFEPVHIDPVFMEQIAGTAEFNEAREKLAAETVAPETVVSEAGKVAEPEAPIPAAPVPPTITKPVPVTLHGLAPGRGKPVQVFTSAVSRSGDIQVPRETGLPLRPTMVWGLAPKLNNGSTNAPTNVPTNAPANVSASAPASVPLGNDEKAAANRPIKSIPVPEKRDPRPTEIKPRRSEVRILPVQVKQDAPQRQKEPVSPTEPAGKPERPKDVAPATKEMALKGTPAEKPKAAAPPVEIRPAAPVPAAAKTPLATPRPSAPPEEPDLLGLPKLSFQHSESFWTRLPIAVRIGAIAAVLALVVGGVVLTSRGSGAPKSTVPAENEPQMVEAGSALANTAGWMQDWFADGTGSRQGRHVDVLRGSLTLRDYRLLFEGEIEHGALGWVFRANGKSFYVEKIQVVTPGLEPVMALVHFAVINGQEQPRSQVPLPIQAHLDTAYKVRMDAVGNRFTTWVQDQKVDQWTDSQIDAGGVGLYYDSGDSAKLRDTLNVIPLKQK
jgi:hypothetical protein